MRSLTAVLLTANLMIAGISTTAAAAPGPSSCTPGQVQTLTVPDPSAYGGARSVWVYRPAEPDSPTVPVVYFLHGLPGGAGDAQSASFAALVDHYRCLGHRPVVLVAPDGNVIGGTDTEWADDARGRFDLETFVTSTLIQQVEGPNLRSVSHRALIGFSMGGFAAVTIGLRHRIYARVASLAGYYTIDDPAGVFGTRDLFHDPEHLLSHGHALPVLLEDAAADPDNLTAGGAVGFGAIMRARNLPVTVRVLPGHHSLGFVGAQLPSVLTWLEGGWPKD
jgi:S-formylglutathione hydrolase FrmB